MRGVNCTGVKGRRGERRSRSLVVPALPAGRSAALPQGPNPALTVLPCSYSHHLCYDFFHPCALLQNESLSCLFDIWAQGAVRCEPMCAEHHQTIVKHISVWVILFDQEVDELSDLHFMKSNYLYFVLGIVL